MTIVQRIAFALAALLLGACSSVEHAAERPPDAPTEARLVAPATWTPIGRSVEGRVIEAMTLGSGARRVLIIGGIHGDETEGSRHVEALVAGLREAQGAGELDAFTLMVIRDGNPDGRARGTRANTRGVDLNRNWPARNFEDSPANGPAPLSEPETRAMHGAMVAFGPEAVLVLHSSRNGPFVNFDGEGERLAQAFVRGAGDARWRVVPSMGYPTPGSLGSWFGVDGRGPILTIEFRRGEGGNQAREALLEGTLAALRALDK